MKKKNYKFLATILMAILFACCHKTKDAEDPHNHTLLPKELADIRKEIAGKWQVKRLNYRICPFFGPCIDIDSVFANNEGNLVYFLQNDTIKITGAGASPLKAYDRSTVLRIRYDPPFDSAYVFRFDNGNHQYLMREIKNDTLIIDDRGVYHFLTRKP